MHSGIPLLVSVTVQHSERNNKLKNASGHHYDGALSCAIFQHQQWLSKIAVAPSSSVLSLTIMETRANFRTLDKST